MNNTDLDKSPVIQHNINVTDSPYPDFFFITYINCGTGNNDYIPAEI